MIIVFKERSVFDIILYSEIVVKQQRRNLKMQTIADYLIDIFNFFTSNWIAAGVLALVIVVAAIKKPLVKKLCFVFIVLFASRFGLKEALTWDMPR